MSYPIDYTFSLGTASLTVHAQLYTTLGAASGAAITTGIVELGDGWYSYHFAAMAPTFRGSIKFYDSADATTCVFCAVDGVNVGSVDGVAVETENSATFAATIAGAVLDEPVGTHDGLIAVNLDAKVSEVWTLASAIDGKTPQEALQYISAILAGKVSGAGTGTETFVGLDGTTDRVVVTVDTDGNRSAVEYDPA